MSATVLAGFFTTTVTAQSPQDTGIQQKFAETLVVTNNPATVEAQLKSSDIQVRSKTKLRSQEKTIYVLDEPFVSPRVLALGLDTADTTSQPNYTYRSALTPNDPKYPDQWNLPKISAPKAWDTTTGSTNTTIAVIDTGVLSDQSWGDGTHDESHVDLPASKMWQNSGETLDGTDTDNNGFVDDLNGWDFMGGFVGNTDCPNFDAGETSDTFISEDNDPQPYSCDNPNDPTLLNKLHWEGDCGYNIDDGGACFIGHGTIVGSVAAAATDNSEFIAGIDWNAQLMNLRVLDGYGVGNTAEIVEAIDYATDNGADAINMSLAVDDCSGSFSDPAFETALKNARDNNIVAAAASGNGGLSTVCYPASSDHTIAVGATDQNDNRQSYSNAGPTLDVVAPAGVPAATAPSDSNSNTKYHGTVHGTSLSTPHVAGLAGLVKASVSDITANEAIAAVREGANRVKGMDDSNRTDEYGHGRINGDRSLRFIELIHPDGYLTRAFGNNAVHITEAQTDRRPFPSPRTLFSQDYNWGDVKVATPNDNDLATASPDVRLREGDIVKGSGDGIYAVVNSDGVYAKRHFTSWSVYTGLGYTLDDVRKIDDSLLPPDNGDISDTSRHPDGTLVSADGDPVVYLIENDTKRKFPDPETLFSQGYTWGDIKEATPNDLTLADGSDVTFREGTLIKSSDPAIYAIDHKSDGTVEKRVFSSWLVFKLLGNKLSDVYKVSDDTINSFTTGSSIQ